MGTSAYQIKNFSTAEKLAYITEHTFFDVAQGEYITLNKDMKVFKKTCAPGRRPRTSCITNLIVPAGAMVFVGYSQLTFPFAGENMCIIKCRASSAFVHSSAHTNGSSFEQTNPVVSFHNSEFQYIPGETVRPNLGFYTNTPSQCAAGIHFFVTLKEALNYR